MPMAAAAAKYSSPADLTPPMPGGGAPPPAPMAAVPQAPTGGMGMPSLPAPGAPAQAPWQVRLQADGSSVYVVPSPDGDPTKDIILGRNEPPKMPKALQAPAPQGA